MYIFTTETQELANNIMDLLDPTQVLFSGALSKNHCLHTQHGILIKDLRIIQNKNLNNILIVDKSVQPFSFQIENGIPIIPWKDNTNDFELIYLAKYLTSLAHKTNLRTANSNYLKLTEISNKTIEELYKC